jgi:transposase-like protein
MTQLLSFVSGNSLRLGLVFGQCAALRGVGPELGCVRGAVGSIKLVCELITECWHPLEQEGGRKLQRDGVLGVCEIVPALGSQAQQEVQRRGLGQRCPYGVGDTAPLLGVDCEISQPVSGLEQPDRDRVCTDASVSKVSSGHVQGPVPSEGLPGDCVTGRYADRSECVIYPDRAVLFCQVTVADDRCPGCGQSGSRHDTVLRRFTHLPLGHRPTWLQVATPRYECSGCGRVWRHRLRTVARRRSRLTRAAGMWALAAVVLDHVPVSSVARILGVAWQTAHAAVAELGRELLITQPARLEQVQVIGVDEH